MKIPNWITKVADLGEEPKAPEATETNQLNLEAYEQLLAKKTEGTLKDEEVSALKEIEELLKVAITAAEQLAGVKKEAATPMFPKQKKDVLPPKIKEPETTKWKEIRFNKRTGTWQVVITTRHVRNFLTENEAIDFTKKASLATKAQDDDANRFCDKKLCEKPGGCICSCVKCEKQTTCKPLEKKLRDSFPISENS